MEQEFMNLERRDISYQGLIIYRRPNLHLHVLAHL